MRPLTKAVRNSKYAQLQGLIVDFVFTLKKGKLKNEFDFEEMRIDNVCIYEILDNAVEVVALAYKDQSRQR